MSFRALREGVEVFASKARSGPTPLRSGFAGSGCARWQARVRGGDWLNGGGGR